MSGTNVSDIEVEHSSSTLTAVKQGRALVGTFRRFIWRVEFAIFFAFHVNVNILVSGSCGSGGTPPNAPLCQPDTAELSAAASGSAVGFQAGNVTGL